MALSNAEIAHKLLELSELLRHRGESPYKVRAYRNAARALLEYPESASDLVARGQPLTRIPAVGKGISAAIEELLTLGSLARVTELSRDLPAGASDIAIAAGIPVRDAERVIRALGVNTVQELRERLAAADAVPGLNARLGARMRSALASGRRMLWFEAQGVASRVREFVAVIEGVERVEMAGSFRRGKETVGELRLVVQTSRPTLIGAAMKKHAGLADVRETPTGMAASLTSGLSLSVRFADAEEWGDAMVEETGSAAHLEEARTQAPRKKRRRAASEEEWYGQRGLPYIPPELREGRGEVRAALEGQLSSLIELGDIRGDLHAHTTASDGASTLDEMARAAREKGYSYLAITDHSKSLKITRGLDEKRLAAQMAEIDRFNQGSKGFRLLKGSEVDILEDGTLDFANDVLSRLDIVICSIHSRFALGKAEQSRRLVRAIQNPFVTCVGHMTGRLLLRRPGYDLEIDEVLAAIKRHGKFLEINASPDRLDIDDDLAIRARRAGIPLLVNTDAHSVRELDFMVLGVQQARRGWQTRDSIVNTLPPSQLLRALRSTRRTASRAV